MQTEQMLNEQRDDFGQRETKKRKRGKKNLNLHPIPIPARAFLPLALPIPVFHGYQRLDSSFFVPHKVTWQSLPYTDRMIIRTRREHPFVARVPRHRVHAPFSVSRKRLKQRPGVTMPNVYIRIFKEEKKSISSHKCQEIPGNVYLHSRSRQSSPRHLQNNSV